MPKVKHNALTAAKIRTEKTPGTYADGNGLNLLVDASGNKRWFQRITVGGKRRNVGLGTYPQVSLAEARNAALDNLAAVRQGIDPVAEKQRAREAASRPALLTFRAAAAKVIEIYRPTWSSDRHAKQWEESLELHAYPKIGDKPVDEITTADTMAVVEQIWTEHRETASRVRQRMAAIFDYCIVQNWRPDNPASTALIHALPRHPQQVNHHRALCYLKIPAAVELIRGSTATLPTRLALEFMALTAARGGEVRGATWVEINVKTATWKVPAHRMKSRRDHNVPLAARALEILEEVRFLENEHGLIFPNKRSGEPLSNMAFSSLMNRLKIDATPHGFRSNFKDWTRNQKRDLEDPSEAALGHMVGSRARRAYARDELLRVRRPIMAAWAAFVTGDSRRRG